MALNVLVDKYHQALQDKQHMVGLFIDLSRAFDTLSHDILLKKLYKYGIRGSAWNWVKSYLSGGLDGGGVPNSVFNKKNRAYS